MSPSRAQTQTPSRHPRMGAAAVLAVLLSALPAWSEVVVHPALPITRAVTVQPIRVQSSNGTVSAPVFGGDGSYAEGYLESQVEQDPRPVRHHRRVVAGRRLSQQLRPQRPSRELPGQPAPAEPPEHDPSGRAIAPKHRIPSCSTCSSWKSRRLSQHRPGQRGRHRQGGLQRHGRGGRGRLPDLDPRQGQRGHDPRPRNRPQSRPRALPPRAPTTSWPPTVHFGSASPPNRPPSCSPTGFGTDGFDFLRPTCLRPDYSVWADGYGLKAGQPGDDDDGDRLAQRARIPARPRPTTPDNHAMPMPVVGLRRADLDRSESTPTPSRRSRLRHRGQPATASAGSPPAAPAPAARSSADSSSNSRCASMRAPGTEIMRRRHRHRSPVPGYRSRRPPANRRGPPPALLPGIVRAAAPRLRGPARDGRPGNRIAAILIEQSLPSGGLSSHRNLFRWRALIVISSCGSDLITSRPVLAGRRT